MHTNRNQPRRRLLDCSRHPNVPSLSSRVTVSSPLRVAEESALSRCVIRFSRPVSCDLPPYLSISAFDISNAFRFAAVPPTRRRIPAFLPLVSKLVCVCRRSSSTPVAGVEPTDIRLYQLKLLEARAGYGQGICDHRTGQTGSPSESRAMGCFSEILTAGLDRRARASDKGSSERGPEGGGRAIHAVPRRAMRSLSESLWAARTSFNRDDQ